MKLAFTKIYIIFCLFITPSLLFAQEQVSTKEQPTVQDRISQSVSVGKSARTALKSGDFILASNLYAKAFELNNLSSELAYNAACAFALSGSKDSAFNWLEKALVAGYSDFEHVKTDSDLVALHADNRWDKFLSLVEKKAKWQASLWESEVWKSEFKDVLSENERIAGLSKFWSEVKYNFVYTAKLKDLEWDRLYFQFLPRVRNAKNTFEYYQILMEMCALLSDGHTNVYPPQEIFNNYIGVAPLRAQLIDGRVYISEIGDQSLADRGVQVGAQILRVNSIPILKYVNTKVLPYVSASTTQDRDMRLYFYQFLMGDLKETLTIEGVNKDGKAFVSTFNRVSFRKRAQSFSSPSNFEWRMLPNNIAYVQLNSFGSNKVLTSYLKQFPEIQKASGIIFDLRKNGGGDGNIGYEILRTLTSESFYTSRALTRSYQPTMRARGVNENFYVFPQSQIVPDKNRQFNGPVILLTSPVTFSAAEDFVVSFKELRRGLIVGEATGGSTGQPLFIDLPGGGSARICTKKDTFTDGTEFVGMGINPDIAVQPTIDDFQNDIDRTLKVAVSALTKEILK